MVCIIFAHLLFIFASKTNNMVTETYQRYLWLLNTLLRCKRLTFREISDKWMRSSLNDDGKPLKLRTFHLHKAAIQDLFDITISCDSAAGYVYYIDEDAKSQVDCAKQWMLNSFNVGTLVRDAHAMRDMISLSHIFPFYLFPQLSLSRLLKLMASLRWLVSMLGQPSKSAMVRATFRMRS